LAFRPFPVKVAKIARESPDAVTLSLDAGPEPRDYKAGQFVTIDPWQLPALRQQLAYFERVKGRREQPRAYSMCSTPDEPLIAITIKEEVFVPGETEYPPLLSPQLVHGLAPGTELEVKGFSGAYVLPDDLEEVTDAVVHLVAGSGVVPNLALLKWSLPRHPRVRHWMVYSNKTAADALFLGELAALERAYPERLRVLHCLTREAEAPGALPGARLGRVCAPLIAEVIPDPGACLVYCCGPAVTRWQKQLAKARGLSPAPRFMEAVAAFLAERGVPKSAIKAEAYG
jgi:3-ketosteroid 9alpha-monooxygenase subunit B